MRSSKIMKAIQNLFVAWFKAIIRAANKLNRKDAAAQAIINSEHNKLLLENMAARCTNTFSIEGLDLFDEEFKSK